MSDYRVDGMETDGGYGMPVKGKSPVYSVPEIIGQVINLAMGILATIGFAWGGGIYVTRDTAVMSLQNWVYVEWAMFGYDAFWWIVVLAIYCRVMGQKTQNGKSYKEPAFTFSHMTLLVGAQATITGLMYKSYNSDFVVSTALTTAEYHKFEVLLVAQMIKSAFVVSAGVMEMGFRIWGNVVRPGFELLTKQPQVSS